MYRQISVFFVLLSVIAVIESFPDGGPADTCVRERFNQPNHGQSRTQPLNTLPFEVVATTDQYQPGQQIQGFRREKNEFNETIKFLLRTKNPFFFILCAQ